MVTAAYKQAMDKMHAGMMIDFTGAADARFHARCSRHLTGRYRHGQRIGAGIKAPRGPGMALKIIKATRGRKSR